MASAPPLIKLSTLLFLGFGAAGLAAPADLDLTFNGTGHVWLEHEAIYLENEIQLALQPDGKILVAGDSYGRMGILRYTTTGGLDPTFNETGGALSYYGGAPFGIAVQPDGKIIVGGNVSNEETDGLGAYRFHPDGRRDEDFGLRGQAMLPIEGHFRIIGSDMLLQSDGCIVVAGSPFDSVWSNHTPYICRFSPTGSLDLSFNETGFTYSSSPSSYLARKLTRRPDGGFLLATTPGVSVRGFLPDGRPDIDYYGFANVTGQVKNGVIKDAGNGKIWFAGTLEISSSKDMMLVRLSANGEPDPDFNEGEVLRIDFNQGIDELHSMAIQVNGKIVLGGSTGEGYVSRKPALARLNPDGSLDTSFNGTGKLILEDDYRADALCLQKDGKIVVAGGSSLFRLMGDPTVPEIVMEQPADTPLESGVSARTFGPALPDGESGMTFVVKNPRGDDLVLENITFTGTNAEDFEISSAPAAMSVLSGGQTVFSVRFHPASAGERQAVMHVASNASNAPDFTVNLSGLCLSPGEDHDDDGVTNEAEIRMAALGFDPLVDSSALRTVLHANAAGAGLLDESALETLALSTVLLPKDAVTGRFKLRIFLQKSLDLGTWTPAAGLNPQVDAVNGRIDVEFDPASATSQFFKVLGAKP